MKNSKESRMLLDCIFDGVVVGIWIANLISITAKMIHGDFSLAMSIALPILIGLIVVVKLMSIRDKYRKLKEKLCQ